LLQVALQASINAVISVGMTFVITSRGIDLSVGSMAGFIGVLAAIAMRDLGFGSIGGFLVAIAAGAVCGMFNGLSISRAQAGYRFVIGPG